MSARPAHGRLLRWRHELAANVDVKRFGIGPLCAIGGFIVVAVASYRLVLGSSSNRHAREFEAAMTSVFFYGRIGTVLAFIAGMIAACHRSGRGGYTDAEAAFVEAVVQRACA